mgnify:CR=1 FL=1
MNPEDQSTLDELSSNLTDNEVEADAPLLDDENDEEAGDLVELPDGTRVSLDELKRGFLRQSDYTKKTQQLADDRRRLLEAADPRGREQDKPAKNDDLIAQFQERFNLEYVSDESQAILQVLDHVMTEVHGKLSKVEPLVSKSEQEAAQSSFVNQMVQEKMGSAEIATKAFKLADGDPVKATLLLAKSQVKQVQALKPPPTPSQAREDLMKVDTSKMSEEEFKRWGDTVAGL